MGVWLLSDDEKELTDNSLDVAEGPGKQLKLLRENLKLSREAVAKKIRLDEKVIKALEENNFSLFPAPIYVVGHIRNYAKVLDVDPEPFVSAFNSINKNEPEMISNVVGRDLLSSKVIGFDRKILLLIAGLFVITLVGVGVYFMMINFSAQPEMVKDRLQKGEIPEHEVPALSQDTPLVEGGKGLSTLTVIEDANTVVTKPALTGGPTESPPSLIKNADKLSPIHSKLVVTMMADSWVEVKDNQGERQLYNLYKKGEVLVVNGEGPFDVLVGFAPGVSIAYDGQPVNLKPHTRNQVARLVVGESQ